MEGRVCLWSFFLMVLVHLGYGARTRRDDASPMKVVTIVEAPYTMIKDPRATGNSKFKGFIPDLMEKIYHIMEESYELHQSEKYGEEISANKWNGMVGELQDKRADIAAAPMTISEPRKRVIDFSEPFMDLDTVVLFKKSNGQRPYNFSTLEELSGIQEMKFGLIQGGATERFFKNSNNRTIKTIWEKIESGGRSESRLKSNEEGQKKVRASENYVFFMESRTADYYKSEEPCELDSLSIGQQGKYAFGLKKNSEYKTRINDAIKELKKNGEMKKLTDKWWPDKCGSEGNSAHISMTSAKLVLLGVFLYMFS